MLVNRRFNSDDEQWAPVSDLMAVIMLVFMLIAIILFVHSDWENINHMEKCNQSRNMLWDEFKDDFIRWEAKLDEDLTIRFTNQRVLFDVGSSNIKPEFAVMLSDFFPRYMRTINKIRNEFGNKEILAIRIEGHTSSEHKNPGPEGPFIKNMELSQGRARKILHYVLDINTIPQSFKYESMARELVAANGISSSRLICDENGIENKEASRRVEFKLLTKSCQYAGIYDNLLKKKKCL